MDRGKLGKVIAGFPPILAYSIEENLKPTVEYLAQECGMDRGKLGKVIAGFPPILGLSIEGNLIPKVEYLMHDLGMDREALHHILQTFPSLLGSTVHDNMQPKVDILLHMNRTRVETLGQDLVTSSRLFSYSLEERIGPRIRLLHSSSLTLGAMLTCGDEVFSKRYESLMDSYFESNGIEVNINEDAFDEKSVSLQKWEQYKELWWRGEGKEWLLRTKNGRKRYTQLFGN
jgi:mTERF domain-containing protein